MSSTTALTDCRIRGDLNVCPANAAFQYAGENSTLFANMSCPFDSVRQSGFVSASQEGLCSCESALIPDGETEAEPVDCNCYACPEGRRFGFSYECSKPIAGPCTVFNCDGVCNGDLNIGLDRETYGPTAAPTQAAAHSTSMSVTMVLLALTVFRMFR